MALEALLQITTEFENNKHPTCSKVGNILDSVIHQTNINLPISNFDSSTSPSLEQDNLDTIKNEYEFEHYMTDIISNKLNREEIEQILRLCIKHENLVLSFQSSNDMIDALLTLLKKRFSLISSYYNNNNNNSNNNNNIYNSKQQSNVAQFGVNSEFTYQIISKLLCNSGVDSSKSKNNKQDGSISSISSISTATREKIKETSQEASTTKQNTHANRNANNKNQESIEYKHFRLQMKLIYDELLVAATNQRKKEEKLSKSRAANKSLTKSYDTKTRETSSSSSLLLKKNEKVPITFDTILNYFSDYHGVGSNSVTPEPQTSKSSNNDDKNEDAAAGGIVGVSNSNKNGKNKNGGSGSGSGGNNNIHYGNFIKRMLIEIGIYWQIKNEMVKYGNLNYDSKRTKDKLLLKNLIFKYSKLNLIDLSITNDNLQSLFHISIVYDCKDAFDLLTKIETGSLTKYKEKYGQVKCSRILQKFLTFSGFFVVSLFFFFVFCHFSFQHTNNHFLDLVGFLFFLFVVG